MHTIFVYKGLLMNFSIREVVLDLLKITDWPCISIYLPVNKEAFDTKGNAIALKNLISSAKSSLKEKEPDKDYSPIFKKAEQIYEDLKSRKNYGRAIALFISKDRCEMYNLPVKVEGSVLVDRRFNLKPILPLLTSNKQFYILLLNQKDVSLYDCDFYDINHIPFKEGRIGIQDITDFTEFEKHNQSHTAPAGSSTGTDAQFHGQGTAGDKKVHKQKLLSEFAELVDNAIQKIIAGSYRPLLLAGDQSVCDFFRNQSGYKPIMDGIIREKAELLNEKELHEKAVAAARQWFGRAQRQKIESFPAAYENHFASTDIKEVIPAARNGKVADIFIDTSKNIFGRYEEDKEGVFVGEEYKKADSEELINLAAMLSFGSDANIYEMPKEEPLKDNSVACIFRY